jgi:hypothetical protein
MKNKWPILLTIILLISVCFTFAGCGDINGQQGINVQAIENILIPTPSQGFNTPLAVISNNQTVFSANITTTDNQTITLRNPTFEEMRAFILKDPTNHHEFIPNKYECRHFATEVDNNAKAAGWRCGFALLCYTQGQHAVVAFNTIDRGLIFIEPQTDVAIDVTIGGKYQEQDIMEILIAW